MTRLQWSVFLANLLAFLLLAVTNPIFDGLNLKTRAWINRTRRPALRPLMVLTHHLVDVPVMSTQLLAVGLIIGFFLKDWYRATVLVGLVFLQTLIVGVSKHLSSIDRPPQVAAHVFMTSGSYPSGHSAISLSYALLLPTVLRPYLPDPLVLLMCSVLGGIAVLTAYGRLYLDVHWLTDVLGGWFLAAATYLLGIMLL
ncbi:MAG: phosphatase PAP2 family protein [Ruminococcaceae bacterium]|nr:phosphatase PAP2 family protein [Oscillospiraceae bacterium]